MGCKPDFRNDVIVCVSCVFCLDDIFFARVCVLVCASTYVCVCVCVSSCERVCVCVCVCGRTGVCLRLFALHVRSAFSEYGMACSMNML